MITLTVDHRMHPRTGRVDRDVNGKPLLGPVQKKLPENSGYPLGAPDIEGCTFAFWSVRGAASGNYVTLDKIIGIDIGTRDVTANAWYLIQDDGYILEKWSPNVFVDAFDIDTGQLFNEAFVWVVNADKTVDPPLTKQANVDGFVPTKTLKFVEAKASVETHFFNRWECVADTKEGISGGVLGLIPGSASKAFAFFNQPRLRRYARPFEPNRPVPVEGTWVSWGVKVDGGGPTGGGPVGPGPQMIEIAAGLALAEMAGKVDRTLRADVLKLAAKQVSLATDRLKKAMDEAAKAAKK